MSKRYAFWVRCFPELQRFPNDQKRKAALRSARRDLWTAPITWLVLGGLILFVAMLSVLPRWWLPRLGFSRKATQWIASIISGAGGGVMGAFSGAVFLLLLRRRVQTSLRRQLARLDVPICIRCGYDLTGNVSGVCPECGERV